jgi:hypothetical protein
VKHPAFEVAITSPEEMPIFHYPEERVLHQVFAQLTVAHQGQKKAEQRFLIPFEKESQLIQVSVPDFNHQCIVRKRFQISGDLPGFQAGLSAVSGRETPLSRHGYKFVKLFFLASRNLGKGLVCQPKPCEVLRALSILILDALPIKIWNTTGLHSNLVIPAR